MMGFFRRKRKYKIDYIIASEIAEHFNITARVLNGIFEILKWSEKEDKNWIATELGLKNGAKEINFRGTKSIRWDSRVKNNFELIRAVKEYKVEKMDISKIVKESMKKPISIKEKKRKGDEYELFIAKHYKEQGYTIRAWTG